jgi:hypothetical protein
MIVPQYLYGSNDDLQRYFALLVQSMQTALSDNGWTVPQQDTANIATLINMNTLPVLPVGTIWYDTDLNKLKVLTSAAVPGVSNGITETITSA